MIRTLEVSKEMPVSFKLIQLGATRTLWRGEVPTLTLNPSDLWLSKVELQIRQDYYSAFATGSDLIQNVPAIDFLAPSIPADLYTEGTNRLMCPEMPVSSEILAEMGPILRVSESWGDKATVLLHAGREGATAPLHFDWDHSWVLHVCVTGTKRLLFFPPESGWLLDPILNTSALMVPCLVEYDRRDILDRLDGSEIQLVAGTAALFPSLFWHCAIYDQPSLSLSFRFEKFAGARPFSVLPRSWLLQRVIWEYFRSDFGSGTLETLRKCADSFLDSYDDWLGRYLRVQHVFREILSDLGARFGVQEHRRPEFDPQIVIARSDLEWLYSVPDPHPAPSRKRQKEKDAIADYLFAGLEGLSGATKKGLTDYALSRRSGLPPRTSQITIER